MEKRYQVFVSSTYADLKTERGKVIQALMEMDCIPAGMELFPAADDEQWEFIKRVIEDCDYYVLIVGARYGSLSDEGISYTEKEFDYAKELGLPILSFLHQDPDSIPVRDSEIDPTLRAKLDAFRARVSGDRLVKFWTSADQLPGLVALSLQKTIKTHPGVGWVRSPSVTHEETLEELNELRKTKERLEDQLAEAREKSFEDTGELAGLDEFVSVPMAWKVRESGYTRTARDTLDISWKDIIASMGPELLHPKTDGSAEMVLGRRLLKTAKGIENSEVTIDHDVFVTIRTQLVALGFITVTYSPTVGGQMGLFWSLTRKGQSAILQLRSVKAGQ